MQLNDKKMISALVKEGRVAKGYTQKELSELSNISVRSIQRIENGDILPRSYTLKTLAQVLEISFDTIREKNPVPKTWFTISKGQKIILTVSIPLLIFFACWAFIAQSSRFPETTFELLVLIVIALLVATAILTVIWRAKS